MPFVSEKQRRFLYSQKPAVAEKFAAHAPKKSALPKTMAKTKQQRKK